MHTGQPKGKNRVKKRLIWRQKEVELAFELDLVPGWNLSGSAHV